MDNIWGIIISALTSSLIASIVTLCWQKHDDMVKAKKRVFETLMGKRHDITCAECVEAMNLIDVVFYNAKKVRDAWHDYLQATNTPDDTEGIAQERRDKHLHLLEVMAEDVGYKEIKWDSIKHYYFPNGLSVKMQEEAVLRRLQIESAAAQMQQAQEQKSAQATEKQDQNTQLMLAALQNPEGLNTLFAIAEKVEAKKNQPVRRTNGRR